jgi:hypothetical protein
MPNEYQIGTPSIEEWQGPWKCKDNDPEMNRDEWLRAWNSLDRRLSAMGKNGFDDDCDFFLVSTEYDDRTLHIEVVNPHRLTISFLVSVQQWIREEFPNWRVVIPTFTGNQNAIAVYKDTIRVSRDYESDFANGLPMLRERMLGLAQFSQVKGAR